MRDTYVIYFNQWFSSIGTIIEDIKKRETIEAPLYIIGSSKNKDHAYKNIVDKFIVEDWEKEDNYIKWLLDTLKENKVQLFFCKKHTSIVLKHMSEIKELGVKVVLDSPDSIKLMESKSDVYRKLVNNPKLSKYIPEYYNGNNLAEIEDIIKSHSEKGTKQWCLKLDSDEGGASFRKIEQSELNRESLNSFRVNSISSKEALELVENINRTSHLKQLLFMELLDSPEISIDCYDSLEGFESICRIKLPNSRVQRIYKDDTLHEICKEIGKEYNLKFPFNVQFRYEHDSENLKLLEINPRISGGSYYYIPFGINICNQVINNTLGIKDDTYENIQKLGIKEVTHLEKVITLN
jgi:hypothetical protein